MNAGMGAAFRAGIGLGSIKRKGDNRTAGVAKYRKGAFGRAAATSSASKWIGVKTNGYTRGLQRAYDKEKGYVDTFLTSLAFDTTGSIALLNTIPQNSAVTGRVGKKIAMTGLQCRGFIANQGTASANDCAYIIVYDKRPTGALPAITDVLVSINSFSMNNDSNAGRFRILKRWDGFLVGNLTFTGVVANAMTDIVAVGTDFWLDLKSASTVYKAAGTGAIGDIEEGALYLITIGGTASGPGNALGTMNFRVRFLDV